MALITATRAEGGLVLSATSGPISYLALLLGGYIRGSCGKSYQGVISGRPIDGVLFWELWVGTIGGPN